MGGLTRKKVTSPSLSNATDATIPIADNSSKSMELCQCHYLVKSLFIVKKCRF